MTIRTFLTIAAIAAMGAPIMAQADANPQVACSEPANAGIDACLGLPDSGVTNAAPAFAAGISAGAVAGGLGLVAIAAVAASNSSNSTTSTTSTVSH